MRFWWWDHLIKPWTLGQKHRSQNPYEPFCSHCHSLYPSIFTLLVTRKTGWKRVKRVACGWCSTNRYRMNVVGSYSLKCHLETVINKCRLCLAKFDSSVLENISEDEAKRVWKVLKLVIYMYNQYEIFHLGQQMSPSVGYLITISLGVLTHTHTHTEGSRSTGHITPGYAMW